MIRVLHLVGRTPDYQTERALAALRRDDGEFSHASASIGRGGGWRNPVSAGLALRRRAFDLVHAWDEPALAAAALAGRGRVLFSPSRFLAPRAMRWLRAAMAHRDVHVACPTATQQRACVARGVPADRCHLIRPGVDFARARGRRDAARRAALGFDEGDFVLLAPGESEPAAGHLDAVWTASILHVLDPSYKVLIWGRGRQARAAERLAEKLHQHALVHSAQRRLGRPAEFEELLPAADAVLAAAPGPAPTLPVAACMAAGLPIVGRVTYTVSELLEDHHTALMVPRRSPRMLAQRVMELRADERLRRSIADRARAEAFEYFPLTRFVEQYRAAYRQLAGKSTMV